MILAIDLDDVVYDFHTTFTLFGEEELQRKLPPLKGWDIYEYWGISKSQYYDIFDKFIAEDGFLKGKPIDGSLTFLRKTKHDVYIVTSRSAKHPSSLLQMTLRESTANWLYQNNFPHKGLLFLEDKELFHADILLDDAPKNLIHKNGRRVICFDQPWNQEWQGERVKNWKEFASLIGEE